MYVSSASQPDIERIFRDIIHRLPASFITSHEAFAAPFVEVGLFSWKAYEHFRQGREKAGRSSISKNLINIAENLPQDASSFSIGSLWESNQTYLA